MEFSLELIQAISDWQRGGDEKQKKKRGSTLKEVCLDLPEVYRTTGELCYRQIALKGRNLMHLGTTYQLSETISSWTTCEAVAKGFKGGVPPKGDYQGAIFSYHPAEGEVIVDLTALFESDNFSDALEEHKDKVSGYSDGIGRWGNSQKEVVVEIEQLPLDALKFWGGYSGSLEDLAETFYGRKPSLRELQSVRTMMDAADVEPGAYWLSGDGAVKRVNERLKFHAERLSVK